MKNIVNEILIEIFKNLDKKDLYACLQVNEQWLMIAQSILYREISIDIGFTDNIFNNSMLDTLANSSFSPGTWVRKITIARLKVPDNLFSFDLQADPLHLLMTQCPFVEEFLFERTNFIQEPEWFYINCMLEKGGWRVRNLAQHYDPHDHTQYYAGAYLMCDTLRRFYLKRKVEDYKTYWRDFTRLDSLTVARKVVYNIIQCDPMLAALPHLVNLDVTFQAVPTHKPQPPPVAKIYNAITYPKINSLQLKQLPLSGDTELMYIIQKFPKLEDINIKVAQGKPWPITKISVPVLQVFYAYIDRIPKHTVTFRDTDIMLLLKEYYTFKAVAVFELRVTNFLDVSGKAVSFEFTNVKQKSGAVMMAYNVHRESIEERVLKIKRALYLIGENLKEVNVTLTGEDDRVNHANTFISSMFEYCPKLNSLVLLGGDLTSEPMKGIPEPLSIQHLTVKKTKIDLYAFKRLTYYLPYLETFTLEKCTYVSTSKSREEVTVNFRLNMERTAFGNLTAVLDRIPGTVYNAFSDQPEYIECIFITVVMTGEVRYFSGQQGKVVQVSKNEYFQDLIQFRKEPKRYTVSAFLFSVKSVQTLTFITPNKTNILIH